jgi:hypothetical protein
MKENCLDKKSRKDGLSRQKDFSIVSKFVFKLELCAWIVTYPSEGHAKNLRGGFFGLCGVCCDQKNIAIIKWDCDFIWINFIL